MRSGLRHAGHDPLNRRVLRLSRQIRPLTVLPCLVPAELVPHALARQDRLPASELLESVGLTVNKNTIPGEKRSPTVASGIRVGTPAVTTRGMVESDMDKIAEFIRRVIDGGEAACPGVKADVQAMMAGFPLYEGFPNA